MPHSFHSELTAIAFLVLIGACIVSVYTVLQANNLRTISGSLQKQVYGAHFRKDAIEKRKRDENVAEGVGMLRAYGLLLYAKRSRELNLEYPDARFVSGELRSCGPSKRMEMVQVEYVRPQWFLVQKARSSNQLVNDIERGLVTYLVVDGRPCRVRTPSMTEMTEISRIASDVTSESKPTSTVGSHALLVVPTSEAELNESVDKRGCAEHAPYAYAFRRNMGSEESWVEVMERLAKREEGMASSGTTVHAWGYSML